MNIEPNDEAPVPESRNSVTDESGDQEPQERDAAIEKRYRRKSLRRQLQDVIDQLGKASKDPHQKPAKKIDALLRQSEVLLRLQAMDAEDRDQTLQDEHSALTAQHAADAQRIGRDLVATHRAIAFLDPPANGSFAGIIGAIQLLLVRTTPLTIACQAAPQVPSIQIQETQPIGQARNSPFLGRSS